MIIYRDMLHLEFIYNRMINVYKENPNYDYMLRFMEIIDALKRQNLKKPDIF